MIRRFLVLTLALAVAGTAAGRELTSSYVITAVANTTGLEGTDWHSDVTSTTRTACELPLVHAVPSVRPAQLRRGADRRRSRPAVRDPQPVGHPRAQRFRRARQTGALLVYADDQRITCPGAWGTRVTSSVFARTYTLNPNAGGGEFGQAVPGFPANLGMDCSVIALPAAGLRRRRLPHQRRCGLDEPGSVKVRSDLQDADGNIIDRRDHWDPAVRPRPVAARAGRHRRDRRRRTSSRRPTTPSSTPTPRS